MIKFDQLKNIHLEISNNCQASCPMCTRNIHGGLENPLLKMSNWSLSRFKKIVNREVLDQVNMIYFCGNYGDPLMNSELIDMIEYAVKINPHVSIRIHTNGSLRDKNWWKKLYHVLPIDHSVVFAIDGLEDSHSIYRIGTNYKKILENAKTFIQEGGNAEWAFIRFQHNEHQVEEAKKIASDLNFKKFVMKDSSRWLLNTKFPVYDNKGETIYFLEPSKYSELKFIDKKIIDNYKSIIKDVEISCHALKSKEIYIDAQGHVFPCCWLAMIPYQPEDVEKEVGPVRKEILQQYHQLVESLGGIDSLDAEKKSVKEIVNSEMYQTVWNDYWGKNKLITCARTCGVMPELFSTPNDQFIQTETL